MIAGNPGWNNFNPIGGSKESVQTNGNGVYSSTKNIVGHTPPQSMKDKIVDAISNENPVSMKCFVSFKTIKSTFNLFQKVLNYF